ncbi:MAG: protocatechuate 3,4-dioxygenase subunit alpha [Acidobacteria bacterium]|nr:protocatechuate 3,4-dioxygenase subunit alpha [Acidobacteriota bacterium]
MSGESDLVATPSETVGPFFHFGLATDATLGCVADRFVPGESVKLRIRITDGDGSPVPDALVEIWQLDADGKAAVLAPAGQKPAFRGFGRLPTIEDGTCEFETVRPGRLAGGQAPSQASHINVCLFARGLLRHLHTRVYFSGDSALADDAVLALVPAHRRETLLARPDPDTPGRWLFDLRLQGEDETVFFNL